MKSIYTLCAQFEIEGLRESQGRPRVSDAALQSIGSSLQQTGRGSCGLNLFEITI
jgi:hypothetical protein